MGPRKVLLQEKNGPLRYRTEEAPRAAAESEVKKGGRPSSAAAFPVGFTLVGEKEEEKFNSPP